MTFASASTGSENRTVTSISSPAPYGPIPVGLVVVILRTYGTAVDTTISRFSPSEQPLKATQVPGSGRLIVAAVAPCDFTVSERLALPIVCGGVERKNRTRGMFPSLVGEAEGFLQQN